MRVSKRSDRVIPKPAPVRKDFKTRDVYLEGPKDTTATDFARITYIPAPVTFDQHILAKLSLAQKPQ